MSDDSFVKPAGYELMAPQAQERARGIHRAREQQQLRSITPHELKPGDGVWMPSAHEGAIPAREWLVPGVIPMGQIALLTGIGGEGKTLLAVQLATAAIFGGRWLNWNVKRVRSIIVHCEDDADEMKRRLIAVLQHQGYSLPDTEEDLLCVDRDGHDDSLMYEAFQNDPSGRFTEFFARIETTVKKFGAQLLVLDSLYNFFGGNENNRNQVWQFIGGLRRIARQANCTVVLVAHPGRAGMSKGGDGTSGSTAWHNAVRCRLWLHRGEDGGDTKGPLILEHMKANYGARVEPMEIAWEEGRFVPKIDPQTQPHMWQDGM